jgi:methyltransferase (TIGR00027 family)
MKEDGTPSFTASMVTLSRAIADRGGTRVRDFADPAAHQLLDGPLRYVDRFGAALGPLWQVMARTAALLTRGATEAVPLRTRAIDAALLAAVARGVDRLVILGAGLDARALRLPELAGVTVREVDHPATQTFKRQRLATLLTAQRTCREVIFVPADFARDDLGEALLRSGHEVNRPCFWIWEGVTMYLPAPVVAGTLATIRRLSAPGSQLAVTYIDPDTHSEMLVTGPLRWLVERTSEPFIGYLRPAQLAEMLRAADLELVEDSSVTEWARRFGDFPEFLQIPPWEHMALAGVR